MNNLLFISRAKNKGQISPIVKAQGKSLHNYIFVHNYLITGKGIFAYLKHIPRIRKFVKSNKIDILHAHYSLSGYTAAFSFSRPVVCSLMGSDIQVRGIKRLMIKLFSRYFWKAVIVKSQKMKDATGLKNAYTLPNGVDFSEFYPISNEKGGQKTNYDKIEQ